MSEGWIELPGTKRPIGVSPDAEHGWVHLRPTAGIRYVEAWETPGGGWMAAAQDGSLVHLSWRYGSTRDEAADKAMIAVRQKSAPTEMTVRPDDPTTGSNN